MTTVCILLASTVIHAATASVLNVAKGKPASMSSSKLLYNASTAVDGYIDGGGVTALYIIDTGAGHHLAWWKVDLQREVQDATVRIYFRTDYIWRRNGVKLYTSTSPFPESNPTRQGQLCHTVTGDPSGSDIPDVYNITCPGRWRYLLLYTDTDNLNNGQSTGPTLDFGEVMVLVCSDGTYGEDCTKTCSSRNCVTMTTTCERDGRCPDGCLFGWTGHDCKQFFFNYSSFESVPPCTDNSYYGLKCTKLCSDRKCKAPSASCDRDGTCPDGCEAGWRQDDCTEVCMDGTYGPYCTDNCGQCDGVCDSVDGRCPDGCLEGYYGPDCTDKCGQCDGVCDSVDGRCPAGCLDGYNGTKCDVSLAAKQVLREDKDPGCFAVASLVGAIVGTLLTVVLVNVGIHLCLVRHGRLQWVKNPEDKKLGHVSCDSTNMSNIARKPGDDFEHAQSCSHVHNNDYAVLDSGTKTDNNVYDVIQHKHYQNV